MNLLPIRRALSRATIAQVAQETKLSKRTLFRIKAGDTNITLGTLERLQKWADKAAKKTA